MRTTIVRAQELEGKIMAEMTSRERVLSVLAGEIPDRVPFVEVGIDFPFMFKLLGREKCPRDVSLIPASTKPPPWIFRSMSTSCSTATT